MTAAPTAEAAPAAVPPAERGAAPGGRLPRWRRWLAPRQIGAVYLWLAIIVVFGIKEPHLFLSYQTVTGIANGYSIAGLAALAILVPLATGIFDVSIGATMSLSGVVVANLLLNTSLPMPLIILIGLAVGAAVGLVNSIVVVALRIPSLIGTLAVMGIVGAVAIGVSGNKTVSGPRLSGSFGNIAQGSFHGFAWPVFYVLVIMVILGVLLEQTQIGRYLYATGFSAAAARLAGLRIATLQTGSLVIGGVLGAWAGIVLTAQLSSSTPSSGSAYLLPAFAAVFLGATQFRDLRFNAWGTVVAVFMLATGQYGLLLSGAPQWTPDVFQGAALIAAVGVTQIGSRRRGLASADPGIQ